MKAKITDDSGEFKPFDITLTVESKEEAELLRVIFMDSSLGDKLALQSFGLSYLTGKSLKNFDISNLIHNKIKE